MKIKFGIITIIVSLIFALAVTVTGAVDRVNVATMPAGDGSDEEYVSVEVSKTLWEGVQEVDASWSGSQVFSAADCASFNTGDKIVVTVSDKLDGENLWPQIDLRNGAGWVHFDPKLNVNIKELAVPGKVTFELTEDVCALVKANGFVVTGCAFTFTKVEHLYTVQVPVSAEKGNEARTVWEGSENISWVSGSNKSILIPAANLGTVKGGDIIRVYYSSMRPGGIGRILANWTALAGFTNATLLGSRYYEYTLTEENAEALLSSGLRISGNNYTASRVDIINPQLKYLVNAEVDRTGIRAWEKDEQPVVKVKIKNLEPTAVEALVEVDVDTDMYADYAEVSETLSVAALGTDEIEIPYNLEPGFYNLNVYVNGDNVCSYVIGCDPKGVKSEPDSNLADINAYWENELEILAGIDMEAELTEIESASTENRKVYLVKMMSTPATYGGEPVEIRGFYAEPVGEGTYPAIIQYQGTDGGTSKIQPIGGDDNIGWCELVLSTRGQMLNNRTPEECEWAWLDPAFDEGRTTSGSHKIDYYAWGLNDKEKHYYRGANIDCIRAIDFMESRAKVNKENIFAVGGSQGGSFVYVAAALGKGRIRACAPSITGHSDFRDGAKIVNWPKSVFDKYLADNAAVSEDDLYEFLSYYDVMNLAPRVECPVLTSFSLQDRTDPPHITVAPFNNITKVADEDLQYVVNPFLGHGTASDWKNRYMKFFNRYRTDIEPVDPHVAVRTIWKGSKVIDWNNGGYLSVSATDFEYVEAGQTLRFIYTDLQAGAQSHLNLGWDNSGKEIACEGASGFLPLTSASFSYEVTSGMIEGIGSHGLNVTGVGFCLTEIQAVDYSLLPDVTATVNSEDIKHFEDGTATAVRVNVMNNGEEDADVNVSFSLRHDRYETHADYGQVEKTVSVAAGKTKEVAFEMTLDPGVYHFVATANYREIADYNIAVNLTGIVSESDAQPDFGEYWKNVLEELAAVAPQYNMVKMEAQSTEKRNVWMVEMKSVPDAPGGEPVTVRGYYAEPVAPGRYPAYITYQGYDSNPETTQYVPDGDSHPDRIEFVLSTRGQGINNRGDYKEENAYYGDWFMFNFGDRDSYYYRGAYMDAVRAFDFVASRQNVDKANIFGEGHSQGGALTIAAAALTSMRGNGTFNSIAPAIPFMGDFPDYFKIGQWPSYQAYNWLNNRSTASTEEEMYEFLSYYDTKNLAPYISSPYITAVGLQDETCPPHTNIAPYNNVNTTDKELVVNTMLGHAAHADWNRDIDNFFAARMKGETTSIDTVTRSDMSEMVETEGNRISIKGEPRAVTIYNLSGMTVYSGTAGCVTIDIPGLYILRLGNQAMKVEIR